MPVFVWFMIGACLLFGTENVLIGRYLTQVNAFAMMALPSTVTALSGWLAVLYIHNVQPSEIPLFPTHRAAWMAYIACGFLVSIAVYFYFRAYGAGGTVASMTILMAMVPVFACALKFAIGGGLPTWREIAAFICVFIAVALIATAPVQSAE